MEQTPIAIEKIVNDDVKTAVFSALKLIRAEKLMSKPNMVVLLKPNVLMAKPPERAATTHPAVIKAVIQWVKQFNPAKIYVADSCNGVSSGQSKRCMLTAGIQAVCDEEGAIAVGFEETPRIIYKVPNPLIMDEIVSSTLLKEVDLIINLPKIKTHSMVLVTNAIKNMFGTIIIGNKSRTHARFPTVDYFSKALADIYSVSQPKLTVVDGYLCQEGQKGPSAGDVVKLDLILAGFDPVAIDTTVSKIIGQDPNLVKHVKYAQQKGLGTMDLNQMQFVSNKIDDVKHPFKLPKSLGFPFPLPRFFTEYIARVIFKATITFNPEKCKVCGTCWKNCPVGAITPPLELKLGNTPTWNKKKCIACYCCTETCPHEAVNFKIPMVKNALLSWLGVLAVTILALFTLLLIWIF